MDAVWKMEMSVKSLGVTDLTGCHLKKKYKPNDGSLKVIYNITEQTVTVRRNICE